MNCIFDVCYVFQSNSKLKLVRSLAVCEESSTPFADGPLDAQVGLLQPEYGTFSAWHLSGKT